MKEVDCYLVKENGQFQWASIPREMLFNIITDLNQKGRLLMKLDDEEQVVITGLFIPAVGIDFNLMIRPAKEYR